MSLLSNLSKAGELAHVAHELYAGVARSWPFGPSLACCATFATFVLLHHGQRLNALPIDPWHQPHTSKLAFVVLNQHHCAICEL